MDGQRVLKGHRAKAVACEIPKRRDWHGDTDEAGGQALSKIAYTPCQPSCPFIYTSKLLCNTELKLLLKRAQAITLDTISS